MKMQATPEPAVPLHGRLAWLERDALDVEQRAVYDGITSGPRAASQAISPLLDPAGRLEGPFNAMLFSPRLGLALQEVGASLRYHTRLTDRQREIAILLVSVAQQSNFEWLAHEKVARSCGLDSDELAAIAKRQSGASFDAAETVVVHVVNSLLDQRDIPTELFQLAGDQLGTPQLVELVFLVGYYQLLSLSLRVFRVPLPPGAHPHWPQAGQS
jgi:4-carboxymuconolactone decarboxylase